MALKSSSSSSSISTSSTQSTPTKKNNNLIKRKKIRKNSTKLTPLAATNENNSSSDSLKILTREQVSFEFRENFIYTGYRSPNSSFIACLKSLFKLNNNEVVNFWTHFIPFVLIFIYLIIFSYEYNILNDNFMWPFFIYLSTAAFFLFMSSMAHALNCMSNIARHVCFILDYLSISMYAMGCSIAYKAYSLSSMPHYTSTFFDYYVTIAMCVLIISNIMASASRFVLSYNIRGILRFVALSTQYIFVSLPLFYRLTISYFPSSNKYFSIILKFIFQTATETDDDHFDVKNVNQESNFYFLIQFFFAILSAFLYKSHIPERFFPYRFDILGQSHQIFHICSALATFLQIKAFQTDMFQLHPILHGLINSNSNSSVLTPSETSYYQFSTFYTLFNKTTNTTNILMQSVSSNHSEYRLNENLYKETHLSVNNSLLNLTTSANNETSIDNYTQFIQTDATFNNNFYTYSMKHVDFLTVTLSPYFRTKLTYAFIMLCCLIFNSLILIYYYLKALYFNPWNDLKHNDDFFQNYCHSCCFSNSRSSCSSSSDCDKNKKQHEYKKEKLVKNDDKKVQ